MHWKKTLLFFVWQSARFAKTWSEFREFWSYRTKWSQSFRAGRSSVSDEMPWLNFRVQEFLEASLRPDWKVFEFGGGGSTLFFCKRAGEVITVENHEGWFNTLSQMFQDKGYRHWKGHYVAAEPFTGQRKRSPEQPADFMSGGKGLENMDFEHYARTIHQYPEQYFDLIVVDGRARPSCIRQSLPHLKPGGLLVVDNTERPYYLTDFYAQHASGYDLVFERRFPISYTPDFTQTTVFKKRIPPQEAD